MIVVVTGGGTIAPIDDVRFVANASTGRFSAEIAEAVLARGDEVRLVHAPGALLPFARSARLDLDAGDLDAEFTRLRAVLADYGSARGRLRLLPVSGGSVREYARLLESVVRDEPPDLIFLAIAASDFEPDRTPGKLDSRGGPISIRFEPAPKVIRSVRSWAPDAYLVGFKLLSGSTPAELEAAAARSNAENRLDLTVANDLALLRAGRHTLHLVRPGHPTRTLGPGGPIAERLVELAAGWAEERC